MTEPVNTLEAWLSIATVKLAQPGKERVTFEITSHFDDAVASYRTKGLTDAEAQARALADLGNARKAARRFRKRHLTQSEADFLEKQLDSYRIFRNPWMEAFFVILMGCLLCLGLYYPLRMMHASPLLLAIWAPFFLTQFSFSFLLASRRDFRPLRLMLALDILFWFSFFIFFGCTNGWLAAGPMVLVPSWRWFPEFRLWFKLGKLADMGPEMRPPDAVAS